MERVFKRRPTLRPTGRFHVLHTLEALRRRTADEQGQTMAEYSIVLAVITIGCIAAISMLGTSVISAITEVAGYFP